MKVHVWMLAAVLVSGASYVFAIDPETFCEGSDVCQDDQLNIRFVVGDTLVSELAKEQVVVDQEYPAKITINTKTAGISGFSYGVKHDSAILSIPQPAASDPTCDRAGTGTGDLSGCNPTISGTTPFVEQADLGGWDTTDLAEGGSGFFSAVIFSLQKKKELPIDQVDYPICVVKYKCLAKPATDSKLFFSDELNPTGSPAVTVNLTTAGKSKRPKTVQNAVLKGEGQVQGCQLTNDVAFYFGTSASATAYAMSGTTCPISLRNKGVKGLGFSMGIQKTDTNLAFASTLGSPVVDLVFTKEDGTEIAGDVLKGNTATGAPATEKIYTIERSAVLAANNPGDFLGVTIDATGAWATVGYVSDVSGSGKSIAATTDPTDGCASQQILVVTFGGVEPKFSRGDANGDGKINVTDGVIIAQNIFAQKLVFFNCQDMLDANDDGQLNTLDPVFLLQYIFLKGTTPAAPFKTCGNDPTADSLTCVAPNCQ